VRTTQLCYGGSVKFHFKDPKSVKREKRVREWLKRILWTKALWLLALFLFGVAVGMFIIGSVWQPVIVELPISDQEQMIEEDESGLPELEIAVSSSDYEVVKYTTKGVRLSAYGKTVYLSHGREFLPGVDAYNFLITDPSNEDNTAEVQVDGTTVVRVRVFFQEGLWNDYY